MAGHHGRNKFLYFRQIIEIWPYPFKFVGRYFYWFVKIFSKKKWAILVQKLGEEENLSKSVSGLILQQKSYCH